MRYIMKKILALLLVLCFLAVGALTSCGSVQDGTTADTAETSQSNQTNPSNPTNPSQSGESQTATTVDTEKTDIPDNLPDEANTLKISCSEGTSNCWSIDGHTLTFSGLTADTVCSISGSFNGQIVIDGGDDYKFELEMCGLTLYSSEQNPITILSGDKVTLSAKKETKNYIYDTREAVSDDDDTVYSAAVYATCDLDIEGKGELTVISSNNNGIHTKDDLDVKNLTLSVTCEDNALKGNDSVTITGGVLTLIARIGDGIKTKNTDISSKGNQRGIVTISGGTVNIYAACDGIDAAYDADISGDATVNIYTDSYSPYSEISADGNTENGNFPSGTDAPEPPSGEIPNMPDNNGSGFDGGNFGGNQGVPNENGSSTSGSGFGGGNFGGNFGGNQGMPNENDSSTSGSGFGGGNFGGGNFGGGGRPGGGGNPGGAGGMDGGNNEKSSYSTKGIKADNEIHISGGTVTINSYDDAIHANGGDALENGETATGNILISGGTLTLFTKDDGIHADGTLTVSGGKIEITGCYEGLEGTYVMVKDGDISIISSDDGINATTTSGTGITFEGGTVYIYAGGDGIDSNSRTSYQGILFAGGNITVVSTSGGDSSIDTEQGYTYTGGTVLALCPSSSMVNEVVNCCNFSSVGTKTTLNLSQGQTVNVKVGGDIVASVTMPCRLSALAVYLGSANASFLAE